MATSTWVKLEVDRTPSGNISWIACLRTTAEHYGWLAAFPEYRPPLRPGEGGYRSIRTNLNDGRITQGGRPLRISRAKDRHGQPRTLTNRFRVSSTWRFKDSALLAAVTTADWEWMEGRDGKRRTRQQWIALLPR